MALWYLRIEEGQQRENGSHLTRLVKSFRNNNTEEVFFFAAYDPT